MRGIPLSKAGSGSRLAAQCVAVALAVLFATEAAAATSGYNITSSSSVQFWVNDAPWADLHYTINGGGQLNYRMTASGTNHSYTVTGIPSGATVRYFFTIGNSSGGATDTAWAQFTMGTTNPPPTGTWTVVWEDQFSGSGQPNPANWNYHVGNGLNPGINAFQGWGNGEWEWYRPENAYQQNGNLVIRADYTDQPLVVAGRNWYQRSARITTKGKQSWTYGRIEARIAMPNAIGTWPAFWMMGTACNDTYTSNYAAPTSYYDVMAGNWSSCGEIDIMEHRNSETVTFQNLFWDSRTGLYPWADGMNNEQPSNINVGNVTQFHLYTIEWDANQIRWYVDRETNPSAVHTVDITAANKEEFRKPFYIILNLALSGQFTGYAQPNKADFPLYMYVDYVRVWKKQ
jgi:beta-glucanase (GH16 family)